MERALTVAGCLWVSRAHLALWLMDDRRMKPIDVEYVEEGEVLGRCHESRASPLRRPSRQTRHSSRLAGWQLALAHT